jgi:hypothetical protein
MRIRGLAKIIKLLIALCKAIALYRSTIRLFVPTESQSAYDSALDQVMAACDVLRAIDYADSDIGTNPDWGTKQLS